ncbi:Fluoroacetyl-CoA thioesterase [Caballeronia cordobensis]|uniref:Fluoroacetyl-CoA thioesterase n=1 Tax=Caballeronia cordobensis TaxID=1353886 RepID=A0A158ICB3_CABCO|nr:hotdog domain-containing protein [Caballeronia cordobensis]SAL54097.1 Fluoroacetyl-CoA thioesterase [Caballeronia cordobensis]
MIEKGRAATLTHTVTSEDLASAHARGAGERYPDVLSTPALLALIERACADALRDAVGDGQLSVGVTTHLHHLAPTPPGVEVSATATFRGIEGALYWFDVAASDPGGPVGTASHARAIVERSAIEARAAKRRRAE